MCHMLLLALIGLTLVFAVPPALLLSARLDDQDRTLERLNSNCRPRGRSWFLFVYLVVIGPAMASLVVATSILLFS